MSAAAATYPTAALLPAAVISSTPWWWPDVGGIACRATTLMVLALCIRGRAVQGLGTSTGNGLAWLGRATRLVAEELLLVIAHGETFLAVAPTTALTAVTVTSVRVPTW